MAPQTRSSNPVFSRGASFGYRTPQTDLEGVYAASAERLTYEDVIVHTAGLLGLLGISGAAGWTITSTGGNEGLVVVAAVIAFGLGWWISLSRKVRPAAVIAYAVLEGLALGAISHVYEAQAHGIVAQAAIGTVVIFLTMLGLHRSGRVRATPRMQRVVVGVMLAAIAVSLLNIVFGLIDSSYVSVFSSGNRSGLGLVINIALLVVAALMFTLDFAWVDQAVAAGAPRQEAWRLGYGFMVSVVWVYLELLQLLNRLR
jgi:uncharacterized YccA/Bax inhibitor family protein